MIVSIGTHACVVQIAPQGATFLPESRDDLLLYVHAVTGWAAVYRRNGDGDWMRNSEVIALPKDGVHLDLWPAAALLDLALGDG